MRLVYTLAFCLWNCLITAQTLKPYLHSPTDHSIWISWRTTAGMESTVVWGNQADMLLNTASGNTHTFAADYLWHSVKLEDLQPNTVYYYKIQTGLESSAVFRFRTYASAGQNNGHIRILLVGDTQHPVTAQRTFQAAREKLIEKYGPNLEDAVHLILKQGDNVDAGVLAQYTSMHFGPLSNLSGNIPTMTVLGNHEYYQNSDLSNFFPHFEFDDPDLQYNGLAGSNGEHYYAFRCGPVLFCMLNSNEWWSSQTQWLHNVVQTADADPNIQWIFGTAHHPLRCENWISDGSAYIRDQIIPVLRASEKTAMYTSGHSHMYARGSNRDSSLWEVISGGGGLIQNWNENPEQNYPDVQRSFDVWTYQIMDIDLDAGTMDIECYSIGNQEYVLDNVLIDRFHRYFGKPGPEQPALAPPADSLLTMPYTFQGSAYISPAGEPFNSTEFEVAGPGGNFETDLLLNVKRDFEDYFQIENPAYWSPINQQAGVDIFQLQLDSTQVYQGKNWIRVRYRDQNLEWSPWSAPMPFYAQNGKEPLDLEPIAWWHFNGDAVDATGHGFDGIVPPAGVTFPLDEPVRGQVAQFNNTSRIDVRNGPEASQGLPVVQMTVSGWINVQAADTWGGFIGCIQDNGSYERGWVLGTRNQRFSFALVSENTQAMTYLVDTANFNLNQWYYVTATYNGAAMKLFVNGQLRSVSNEQSGNILYAGLATDWFGIGAYVDQDENWLHQGALDELILWERALSEQEVYQWYVQQSNLAPSVYIDSPAAGQSFIAPASIVVSATAQDTDGNVGVVEFYNGTEKLYEDVDGAPYSFVWENVPPGVHIITAKATDNLGAKTFSDPREVVVLVNLAPEISLLHPANNAEFEAPAQIPIIVHANDADGAISEVAFFANGNNIGVDTDGVPYFFVWENVPEGVYQISAVVTDDHGASTETDLIQVTVAPDNVGTNEIARPRSVLIAPNPTSGAVRFLTDRSLAGARLQVLNSSGQQVLTRVLEHNETDLHTLPPGVYTLDVTTTDQQRLYAVLVLTGKNG
jgi:hypothetical protein